MNINDLILQMNEYYNARARWHDDYMSYSDPEQYTGLLKPIVEYANCLVAGKNVLELACGTGNWTQIIAEKGSRVLATDINAAMLKIAAEKLNGIKNISFLRSDAYTLTGVSEKYNVGFAADWISHIPRLRIESFLICLHRKLKPGSEVVFLEMHHRDHPDLNPYRTDKEGNTIIRRRLPDGSEFDVVKNYYRKEEIIKILQKCSSDIEYKNFNRLSRWLVSYRTI